MYRKINRIYSKNYFCTATPNHISSKSKGNGSRRLLDHFNQIGQTSNLDLFPSELKRITSKQEIQVYIANDDAAQKVTNLISKFHNKNVPLFELNPGPCILSKTLLDQLNLEKLVLIEQNEDFKDIQTNFEAKHGSKIVQKYITYGWQNNISNLISEYCKKRQWHEEIVYQLFTCLRSVDMYRYIMEMVRQCGVFCNGRVEIFAIMPAFEYMKLTAGPKSTYWLYTQHSCMFQILFEYELLCEIPTSSFLPWRITKPEFGGKLKIDNDSFYFIRMVPKRDLFEICDVNDLLSLRFFVHQCLFRRKGYIIPQLEKWIPGIGADLITMNFKQHSSFDNNNPSHLKPSKNNLLKYLSDTFDVFSESGSLTPLQICALFQIIRQSPLYTESSFHQQCIAFYASRTNKLNEK